MLDLVDCFVRNFCLRLYVSYQNNYLIDSFYNGRTTSSVSNSVVICVAMSSIKLCHLYSPDQDHIHARCHGSVLCVPSHIIGPSRDSSKCESVLSWHCIPIGKRQIICRGKRPHYHPTITPELHNYPGGLIGAVDATQANEVLGRTGLYRSHPVGCGRRFKHGPTGRTNSL
jgi:KDO2-lipid IV(A) lauroyltransferase